MINVGKSATTFSLESLTRFQLFSLAERRFFSEDVYLGICLFL